MGPKVWIPNMAKWFLRKLFLFSEINYMGTMLFIKDSYFRYWIVKYEVMRKHLTPKNIPK